MDQKHDNIDRQLTISKIDSLAIIKSGLVKRGLDLTKELRKRCVRVLIGDSSYDNFAHIISDYIQKEFSNNYVFKFEFLLRSEEILEHAKKESIDIFILILNNIYPSSASSNLPDRLDAGLKLSSQIKKQYGKPVIALSGWIEGTNVGRAKSVSDFFFPLPCKLVELKEAFIKCLTMLRLDKNS